MQNDELLYLYICLEYFSREREKEKKYEGVREKKREERQKLRLYIFFTSCSFMLVRITSHCQVKYNRLDKQPTHMTSNLIDKNVMPNPLCVCMFLE